MAADPDQYAGSKHTPSHISVVPWSSLAINSSWVSARRREADEHKAQKIARIERAKLLKASWVAPSMTLEAMSFRCDCGYEYWAPRGALHCSMCAADRMQRDYPPHASLSPPGPDTKSIKAASEFSASEASSGGRMDSNA